MNKDIILHYVPKNPLHVPANTPLNLALSQEAATILMNPPSRGTTLNITQGGKLIIQGDLDEVTITSSAETSIKLIIKGSVGYKAKININGSLACNNVGNFSQVIATTVEVKHDVTEKAYIEARDGNVTCGRALEGCTISALKGEIHINQGNYVKCTLLARVDTIFINNTLMTREKISELREAQRVSAARLSIWSAPNTAASSAVTASAITTKNNSDKFSEDLQDYIDSFKGREKFSDIVARLKLKDDDELEKFEDFKSFEFMDIPTTVGGHTADLKTWVELPCDTEGVRINPITSRKFTLSQIQPDFKTAEEFRNILKIKEDNNKPKFR